MSPYIAPKLAGDLAKAGAEAASAGYSSTAFRTLPPVPALSTIRDCPSGRNRASAMTSGWEGFMEFGVSDYIKADFRLDD